ncbi:MAG: hypothetical protein IPJ34_08160 [Myxococcales bacterium]|nr:hypothetical protein [Myxococcales bacterium]
MIDRSRLGLVMVLSVLAAAPTVGDVGGCNEQADALGPEKFFTARLESECMQCRACGLETLAGCRRACDLKTKVPQTFPTGCRPLVHDGEVCLRAIEALSCEAFADVVAASPIVPPECDFCPAEAAQ